ncbi:MAG: ABC transporter permease, partial [Actinomycetes bacterium]
MKALSAAELRRRRSLIVLATLAILSTLVFGLLQKSGQDVTYGFVFDKEWVLISQWVIGSKTASLLFGVISVAASALSYFQFKAGKTSKIASAVGSAGILMSFISWAAAGKFIPITGLLQGALLLSVPLIFGSMAGVLSERSGVVNIAIEGQLLAGAFVSGVVASLTHSTFLGLVVAP